MSSSKLRIGKCPFRFVPVANNDEVKRDFVGYQENDGLVVCQDETEPGWALCGRYAIDGHADAIYNFDLRDDDVWIVTYPKSGTTWMQHMLWMMLNPDDKDTDVRVDLRSPFVDFDHLTPVNKFKEELAAKRKEAIAEKDHDFLEVVNEELAFLEQTRVECGDAMPTDKRRLLEAHLPFSLMPPDLLKRNKVVYVARDPRDVLISYFFHHRLIRHHEYCGDLKQFAKYFMDEQVLWSPFWDHIAQAWRLSQSHPDNLLFVFFDDMKKDLPAVLDRVAKFLKMDLAASERKILLEKLTMSAMKGNEAVNDTAVMVRLGVFKEGEGEFIRKGGQGGWRASGMEWLRDKMDEWKRRNVERLRGSLPPLDKLWLE